VRTFVIGTRALAVLATAAALLAATGCTSDPSAPKSAPHPLNLRASVNQFRYDEGTRHLKAGVTNDGKGDITVSRATIAWPVLAFPSVRLPAGVVHPGQTAAFTISYGTPRCTGQAAPRPVLVAVVNGRSMRLPLHVDDPGLLDRLRVKACDQKRLDRVASVDLRLARRPVRMSGGEVLPATVVVRHRPGQSAPVRVVDLDGSVLIDLAPRDGTAALPTRPSRGGTLAFPVVFSSAHRCDGHARGQSQQTFLFSAYVRVGSRPEQRVVLDLSSAERDRLIGLVDRDCARRGSS
jgi:hypothetical protein